MICIVNYQSIRLSHCRSDILLVLKRALSRMILQDYSWRFSGKFSGRTCLYIKYFLSFASNILSLLFCLTLDLRILGLHMTPSLYKIQNLNASKVMHGAFRADIKSTWASAHFRQRHFPLPWVAPSNLMASHSPAQISLFSDQWKTLLLIPSGHI